MGECRGNKKRQSTHGLRSTRWGVAALLTAHAALLMYGAARHAPNWDELVHLRAGIDHWRHGDFSANPGNPPLVDLIAAVPALLTGRQDALRIDDADSVLRMVTLGRWCLIPFSLLGAFVCFRWAREMFGDATGLAVLLLWCFDPLILAHGQLITGDLAATALGVAAFYAFWRWEQHPTRRHAIPSGVLLGGALLSKYVWIIMPPLWLLLWLIRRSSKPQWLSLRSELGQIAVIVLAALCTINLGFACKESLQPLSTYQFKSPSLSRLAFWQDNNSTDAVSAWLASLPAPLPRDYLMGIDEVAGFVDSTYGVPYIHGEQIRGGVWHFYLYGLLVKLPLGTWLLLGISCFARLISGSATDRLRCDLVLWLPAVTLLCFVSSLTSVSFLRYVLPVYPSFSYGRGGPRPGPLAAAVGGRLW